MRHIAPPALPAKFDLAPTLGPLGIIFLAGVATFVVPTMIFVARESWTTEQGAHGPIVLLTGLWLLGRQWASARKQISRASPYAVYGSFAVLLPAYFVARVAHIVEVEGYLMYLTLVALLYSIVGSRSLRSLWFPLFYLAFMFPPPDTMVALVTQPLKIYVSEAAVALLSEVGLPVGGEGVTIFIAQYQLLVAEACSGLNSLISLSAISLLYVYVRHQAQPGYAILMTLFIIPIAILSNLVRVLILILLTYYFGEGAAQGFMHGFAGVTMFVIALLAVLAIDLLLKPLWDRYSKADYGNPRSA